MNPWRSLPPSQSSASSTRSRFTVLPISSTGCRARRVRALNHHSLSSGRTRRAHATRGVYHCHWATTGVVSAPSGHASVWVIVRASSWYVGSTGQRRRRSVLGYSERSRNARSTSKMTSGVHGGNADKKQISAKMEMSTAVDRWARPPGACSG